MGYEEMVFMKGRILGLVMKVGGWVGEWGFWVGFGVENLGMVKFCRGKRVGKGREGGKRD